MASTIQRTRQRRKLWRRGWLRWPTATQHISNERLTDRSVARIVKSRVKEMVKQRGRTEAEAEKLVELISGHSLRAGYATSAAARNMPAYRIQSHTRHKSAQVVAGYRR
jgi:hypothetical protein